MKRGLGITVGVVLLASGSFACQVPVFRFALERWPADDFRLLVTSKGALEESLQRELKYLQQSLAAETKQINLELKRVDLATLTEAERASIPGLEHATEKPTFILMPPASWKVEEPAWVGAASVENLERLLDSPARQKCAELISKGESAVWILIECGDAEKDTRAKALLERGLGQAASTIKIPEGVIRREDLNKGLENIDPDNMLRSDVPLKISFATLTISKSDAAESIFLPTLVESDLLALDDPLIIPVFGRGRTPGALPASEATEDRIVGACQYLCGACSCQVKRETPGYDLLFKVTWDRFLNVDTTEAVTEAVQDALEVVTFEPASTATAPATTAGTKRDEEKGRSSLVVAIAIGVVGLAIASWVVFLRPAAGN